MIIDDSSDIPKDLITLLQCSRRVVVFTGAGVSAESGIPTFRDPLTGLWKNFSAEMLATPAAFRRDPAEVWGWYEWRRKLVMRAQPNTAHLAIAQLARLIPEVSVITQNVDDLHERAGSEAVVHLHGSFFSPRCFACSRPHPVLSPDPDGDGDGDGDVAGAGKRIEPPRCSRCNGRIRPGVVWFGERLDRALFSQAKKAARECDVLFSIGASVEVQPAAIIPIEAERRGAQIVQINPSATALDIRSRFNLRMPAGPALEKLLRAAWPDSLRNLS